METLFLAVSRGDVEIAQKYLLCKLAGKMWKLNFVSALEHCLCNELQNYQRI